MHAPALLLIASLGLPSLAADLGPNLLTNGDFESAPWRGEGDERAAQVDMLVSHGGKQSGRLDARPDAERYVYGPAFDVDPAKRYVLVAWLKCQGVSAPDGVHLRFLQWDDKKPVGWIWNWEIGQGVEKFLRTGGTHPWKRFAVVLRKLDPNAKRVAPFFAIAKGAGTAWLDDVTVREWNADTLPPELVKSIEEPAEGPPMAAQPADVQKALPPEFDLSRQTFPPRQPAGASLLANGDFEQAPPADWAKTVQLDNTVKHAGGSSLLLGVGPGGAIATTQHEVNAAADYRLSAWIKTENVPRNGLKLRLWPGWWNESTMSETLLVADGTQDWTRYEIVLKNLPASRGAKRRWLYYSLDSPGEGQAAPKVWLDDAELVPLTDSVRIVSPKLGNFLTEGAAGALTYTVRDVPKEQGRRLKWAVTDFWGQFVKQGETGLAADGQGTAAATVPLPGRGYFGFTCLLLDGNGQALQGETVSAAQLPKPPADAAHRDPQSAFACWGVSAELAPALGVKWTRWIERGNDFTPVPGQADQFDWRLKEYAGEYKPADRRREEQQAGLTTYLCFHQFADWMLTGPDGKRAAVPLDWNRFADWVAFVYRQVTDLVPVVEVWNEPVIPWGWQGTPEDIVTLHRTVYQTVKKLNPNAIVIGPCDSLEHLDTFGKLGGFQWVDALSTHPYRANSPEATDFVGELRRTKEIAAKYGKPTDLWITEMGWTTAPGRFTELEQANWIVRAYVLALSEGVRNLNVHIFGDWNNPSASEKYFGIVRTDRTPKPAAVAYATMTRNLEGAKHASAIDWLGRASYGHVFERDGKPLLVLWNAAGEGAREELPVGVNEVQVERLDGTTETVTTRDGKLELTLGQSPVFVTGAAAELYLKPDLKTITVQPDPLKVAAGDEVQVRLTVSNPLASQLAGEVRISPAGGLSVEPATKRLALRSKGKADIEARVSVPAAAAARTYPLFVELLADGRTVARSTVRAEVLEPVSLAELRPVFDAKLSPAVEATITNQSQRTVKAAVRLAAAGWQTDPSSLTVELKPGASKKARFNVTSPTLDSGRVYEVKIQAETADGSRAETATNLNFLPCIRTKAKTKVDGSLDEWTGAAKAVVGGEWKPLNPTAYHGAADCSAQFMTAWDDRFLYLAVQVQDDVFLQTHNGTAVWSQDNLQLGLDPAPAASGDFNPLVGFYGKRTYEYGLTLTPNGPQVWRWLSGDPENRPGEALTTEVRLAAAKTTNGVTYEAAFPWTSLGVQKLAAGQQLGLALAVNDDDGEGRKAILWFDGIVHSKDPRQYGRITLVGE